MKLGMLVGLSLAAVGGAAYAHKRRGGTLSVDSIKDSLNAAKAAVQDRFAKAKDVVQDRFAQAKDAVQGAVNKASPPSVSPNTDRFGYSEYSIAKGDRDMH